MEKDFKIELEEGKKFAGEGNINVVGSIHQLPSPPFLNESFDLAVCSLALFSLHLGIQREMAIREANRILRKGGYYILTIPLSIPRQRDLITPEIQKRFWDGFDILPFSGFVKATEPKGSRFRVYLTVCKKLKNL